MQQFIPTVFQRHLIKPQVYYNNERILKEGMQKTIDIMLQENNFWESQQLFLYIYKLDSELWKNTVKLIKNGPCEWFPYAKISHGVYILSPDEGPRFRDELKIRVGDLENFANSLFYLAPTKLSVLLSFFHLLRVYQNSN